MMFSRKVSPRRTICEVHREIYDILEEHFKDSKQFPELESRLQECYLMAKKMSLKLQQYKNGWDRGWWEKQESKVRREKLKRRGMRDDAR